MRILWLSPGFAADEQDLHCIPPLQLLARELAAQGVDLQIITLGYPFHDRPYHWHGTPVISGYGINRLWFRWYNWLRVIRYARAYHRQQPFDAIHSFWLGPCWLIGRRLAARWRIPHWTTLMGQDVLPENFYRRWLKPAQARNLVALTDFHRAVLEKTTGLRAAHIIPWGIDPAEIPPVLPDRRPVDVLGCGALIPLKNWALWLETLAVVRQSRPDLRAELIGEGVDRPQLEALIKGLDLQPHVHLAGFLPRPVVLARMRDAKVFLHTARFESYGFVLAEAAMNGCRVVSTPVGIAPELGVCGEDVQALAEQVLKAFREPAYQPLIRFTVERTAKAYRKLYKGEQPEP